MPESAKGTRILSWWPAGTVVLAGLILIYALRSTAETDPNVRERTDGGGRGRIRGPESEPAGWFVYLVDVSGSIQGVRRKGRRRASISREEDTPYHRALGLVSQSILGLRGLTEALPQRHSVIAITSASLYQKPLCDVTVPKVNLFTGATRRR